MVRDITESLIGNLFTDLINIHTVWGWVEYKYSILCFGNILPRIYVSNAKNNIAKMLFCSSLTSTKISGFYPVILENFVPRK